MDLYLQGHDHQYAVEQMLLTLFPAERPVYPGHLPAGDGAVISLRKGSPGCGCTSA